MKLVQSSIIAAIGAFSITAAAAQSGPVANACKDEIAKYCADKNHGSGEVRSCLEDNKDKVAAPCKTALETTGGGRGQGQGRQ